MKTLTISAVLLLAAIVTSSFVLSHQAVTKENAGKVQNVTSLRAHRQGKAIVLTWSAAGSNVAAFHVERSYDGEYFDVIDAVENTGARSYKIQDDFAPGYIYYRICCVDTNGEEVSRSAVEVVRIVQRK